MPLPTATSCKLAYFSFEASHTQNIVQKLAGTQNVHEMGRTE